MKKERPISLIRVQTAINVLRDVLHNLTVATAGAKAVTIEGSVPKAKKERSGIKGIIRRINSGGKTLKMLAVLSDGKVHKATELALAAGTRSGAVHTHLNARVKNGEIKKTGPGLFRLNGRKKKAA